jgi:hypothetical protein
MFRTTAARSVQSLRAQTSRAPTTSHLLRAALRTSAKPSVRPGTLSLALRKPVPKSLIRYETTYQKPDFPKGRDPKAEEKYGREMLAPEPALVSTASSVHPVTGEVGGTPHEEEVDMTASIRSDFVSMNEY